MKNQMISNENQIFLLFEWNKKYTGARSYTENIQKINQNKLTQN